MKKWLKKFRVELIILFALLAFWGFEKGARAVQSENYVRGNYGDTRQRVFDKGNVLTDAEEEKLQRLIEEKQDEVGCDIVVVILDESIRSYALSYQNQVSYYITEDKYVMVYADNFYDDHAFGYDKPYGDGVILVDNWDRSDSEYRYAYNWISTSGRAINKLDGKTEKMIDRINDVVNDNPYKAYERFVNDVAAYMSGKSYTGKPLSMWLVLLVAAVLTLFFIFANIKGNKGLRTTVSNTYVRGGKPNLRVARDVFITKHVTQRRIETSSSGGGGSHHSAGGHSHGGSGGHH